MRKEFERSGLLFLTRVGQPGSDGNSGGAAAPAERYLHVRVDDLRKARTST